MTSILLMFLLSVIRTQCMFPVRLCPASCMVCSENAIICRKLGHIIDAPYTTQALLLTDGFISTVQSTSLSDLNNVTVIGLSHNHISELGEQSFRNLLFLHTLLLDHNLLTSQALQGGALTNLTQLEVLALGHNLINMIQAGWFIGTMSLRSLKLEGNLLTSVDAHSFPLNDLSRLESLDLSDNLIDSLDRNSFRGLVGLRTLDLSRNRLSSTPPEPFSYLGWLTNLNLDLNSWNCSCQLLELAAALSAFVQQPNKTLHNGRSMACVSADNPAITTVLELTEANCVLTNQNITVHIETRYSVTPHLYARDLAITAAICFIGGVSLSLLVVLICCQVSQKKKVAGSERQRHTEGGGSTVTSNLVNHHEVSDKQRDLLFKAMSSHPRDNEAISVYARTDGHVSHSDSRADENNMCFRCPDNSYVEPSLHLMTWANRMSGGMKVKEDREGIQQRMVMDEEKKRTPGTQQDILGSYIPNKFLPHGISNFSSHPWRETFCQRPENLDRYRTNSEMDESCRTDIEGKLQRHEALHRERCGQTYRPAEQDMRHERIHTDMRDSALFDGFSPKCRQRDRNGTMNYNQFDMMNMDLRKYLRNVKFELESSKTWKKEGNNPEKERSQDEVNTSQDKERGIKIKHKVQSSRLLKVKLNLNPLRKNKVHPRRTPKHGHLERGSPKKSKHKRKGGKDRGEEEYEESSGKRTNTSSKIVTKYTKTKRSIKGDEKGEENGGEEKQYKSSEKKNKSNSGQGSQETAEGNQDENKDQADFQPTSTDNTENSADQPQATIAVSLVGLGKVDDSQVQGAGIIPKRSSQISFPISAIDRNHSTNLPLLGSQLTGSNLSLQDGNILFNTMVPVAGALLPNGPTHSIAISGSSMSLSGAPDSCSKQAGLRSTSPATSFLSNTGHANHLQASVKQAIPLHSTQAERLTPNLLASKAIDSFPIQSVSQSQLPHDGVALVPILKSNPVITPDFQSHPHQLSPESRTPQNITDPTHTPLGAVTPQVPKPGTTAEYLPNDNSQRENGSVSGEFTVSMSAVGVSEVSVSGAHVSVSGASAAQGASSTASMPSVTTLLQQEYISEEGGSSPRRKLRLVLPEKSSSQEPTALERKIR